MATAATTRATKANRRRLNGFISASNIASDLDDARLAEIGHTALMEYRLDLASRDSTGWTKRIESAMDLALQTKEAKNYPWPKASNIKYPLLTTAAIQFNARAYPAIVDGGKVVKAKVFGEPNPDKQARADRIAAHMSYQLTEEIPGWEEDTDRLLVMLPIVGCMIRKTWFDPVLKVNRSESVSPLKFVVNYSTKSLDACPRMTQELAPIYPHEIVERQRAEIWLNVDLGLPQDGAGDEQAPHIFLEQHRLIDLDDDDYPEPYIVTVHEETGKVVRIVARYDEDGVKINPKGEIERIEPVRYFTKYPFIPSPDGSFYDIGFGQLLDALNETINSTVNQLMDAGHLANAQGGFIGGGVSIKSGSLRFQPGEWKKVGVEGGVLKDNLVPLPAGAPSAVLMNLLEMLIEASKDITSTKDILTGETQGQNQPVGTTLATIEQGLKVFTAIYKRIHRALKDEFQCLYRLNRLYLTEKAYFQFQDQPGVVAKRDYEAGDSDVVPVSDPSVVTDMQRMGRAQFLMQFKGDPGINQSEIDKRVLEAAGIPDLKALIVPPQPPQPDPKVLVETAKLEHARAELDLKREQVAVALVEAKADIAFVRAQTLAALVAIEHPATVHTFDDGTTLEAPPGQDDEAMQALGRIDQQVDADIVAEFQQIEQANAAQGEPQPSGAPGGPQGAPDGGNVSGMAPQPPHGVLPGLSAGPADSPEGGVGPGGVPDTGPAGQGAAPGGAGLA